MAVTSYYNCAHAGALWQAIAALWADYVSHTDWTWAYSVESGTPGSVSVLTVKITIVKPDDTYIFKYFACDTILVSATRGRQPVGYVLSRPGFNASPIPVLSTYGSRTTITDYASNVHEMKKTLVYNATDIAAAAEHSYDAGDYAIGSLTSKTWMVVYQDLTGPVVMVEQIAVYDTPEYPLVPDANPQNPIGTGIPGCPSGGGSVDTSGIVAAIEELVLVDRDIFVNNGASIFSVRGKVNV